MLSTITLGVMYKCALDKMSGCPEGFDKFPLANREIDFPNLYMANIVWNKKNYYQRLVSGGVYYDR